MKINIPLKRRNVRTKPNKYVAYDLETTRIKRGTPSLKYITAYSDIMEVSLPLNNITDLADVLQRHFLTARLSGYRFVAWNGNHFDAYFIALAILEMGYVIRPYLTRKKQLRGLLIKDEEEGLRWEFLDGMAITGIMKPLKDFLKSFALGFQKLTNNINFDKEEFDANNKKHVEYAERDSEGLYYGMINCDKIIYELSGLDLTTTIGNLGIKYFQRSIPEETLSWPLNNEVEDAVRNSLMRGGYCWIVDRYKGPIWKYDINQAYAAAMRDCALPSGRCIQTNTYKKGFPAIYHIQAWNDKPNIVPFYYKIFTSGKSIFSTHEIVDAWVTSDEYDQLKQEWWHIEIDNGFYWDNSFNMKTMVDKLEKLRHSDPEGPSGPLGSMCKYLGNNCYGKLGEQLDGVELVISRDCPEGYARDNPDIDFLWSKPVDAVTKPYHRPQIASFITAHVRMVVRRAALTAGDNFLYADTDCIASKKPVNLDIHPKRYGAWKEEVTGEVYYLLGKKIYSNLDASIKHAKGLSIRRLGQSDFEKWYAGIAPLQRQLQRQNFITVLSGDMDMFVERIKYGERKKKDYKKWNKKVTKKLQKGLNM